MRSLSLLIGCPVEVVNPTETNRTKPNFLTYYIQDSGDKIIVEWEYKIEASCNTKNKINHQIRKLRQAVIDATGDNFISWY